MGVAGGATRAAMTQHQARRDNMADVAAKDGSQVRYSNAIICSRFCAKGNLKNHVKATFCPLFLFLNHKLYV